MIEKLLTLFFAMLDVALAEVELVHLRSSSVTSRFVQMSSLYFNSYKLYKGKTKQAENRLGDCNYQIVQ